MTANCSVKPNGDRQTFLFEASEMAKENLLIARSLVSPRTGIVPVVGWLVVLRLNVPVNNFSVISGRSHRFLGN